MIIEHKAKTTKFAANNRTRKTVASHLLLSILFGLMAMTQLTSASTQRVKIVEPGNEIINNNFAENKELRDIFDQGIDRSASITGNKKHLHEDAFLEELLNDPNLSILADGLMNLFNSTAT